MQQGGSQYGVPLSEMPTAGGGGGGGMVPNSERQQAMAPESVPPINSRPPQQQPNTANLEELAATVSGNFHDLEEAFGVGEEGGRGGCGTPGNRWPREETLALIKIRSDMDATFRDATLKGPLWEIVSSKLSELGFSRGAKKCKEKFENVHKYYKRTKEGRAGRQDGKTYRFFAELEALHNIGGSSTTNHHKSFSGTTSTAFAMSGPQPLIQQQPTPLTTVVPFNVSPRPPAPVNATGGGGFSFSTNSTSSGSDTEGGLVGGKRKRRSGSSGSGGGGKTMDLFRDLMKQLLDQQESMQRRFLDTLEKREQDRMIREEAWRRQEMARLAREHDAMAQERAMTATRDNAIISFLQRVAAGQPIQLPPPPPPNFPVLSTPSSPPRPHPTPVLSTPSAAPPPPPHPTPVLSTPSAPPPPPPPPPTVVTPLPVTQIRPQKPQPSTETINGNNGTDPTSSRWPKTEVHALIKLRSGLDSRYQDAGPKGPLWEEISAGMKQMGFNRSPKRCKEKWENINKYFKKVKERNKKRPEDAKTCPYFHQLDALYRSKSGNSPSLNQSINSEVESNPVANSHQTPISRDHVVLTISTLPQSQEHRPLEPENNGHAKSNGYIVPTTFPTVAVTKKPGDNIMNDESEDKESCDNMEEDDDVDDEEDEEEQKMAYKIEYQRPNANSAASNGVGSSVTAAATAAAATAGSFLAMVQ